MAISNNLISSSTRKYLPARVLGGYASSILPSESWLYDDGMGDPWWQGVQGAPCKWIVEVDINAVAHSSHLTRVPFVYSGLDIIPGMWMYGDGEGKPVRVVSIVSATDNHVSCLVEDVDRYNTFTDRTGLGNGIFGEGRNVVFFEMGEDGNPLLNPLPDGSDPLTVPQVETRFRVFNRTLDTRIFQLDHGFKEGQVLRINKATGLFVHATSEDLFVVGTVSAVGPGPNYFYITPSTKVIPNLIPGLPGVVGDVIWLDPITGDRTTTASGTNPLYLKLTANRESFAIGRITNPTTWEGSSVKINNKEITFSQPNANSLAQIIQEINLWTAETGVTASTGSVATIRTGTVSYPSCTPASVLSFTFNGTPITVSAPSVTFGDSGTIGWWDIIREFNEKTPVHGGFASFDSNSGTVTLAHYGGGPVNLVNVTPTVTSGEDKTVTDLLGLSASNPSGAANRLKLTRADGGPIVLINGTGSFIEDMNIRSAFNGTLPLALVIDKTMSANANYVVADVAARDALANIRVGDQVFVQTAPDGEWALYVKTSGGWTKISDHDSANTDASTLTAEIDFESTSPVTMGSISGGTRVANVTVVVEQAFNGAAVLSVGVDGSPSAIMSSDVIDLSVVGSYEATSSFTYQGVTEEEILVNFEGNGATQGSARVIVSYL